MKKLVLAAVMVFSMAALAAPPAGPGAGPGGRPGRGADGDEQGERMEDVARRAHTMYVVAIAEALELNEADALKLSEKLKGLEQKRAPVRQQMHEAMRAVKAAADNDATALAQVDANIQKVLDGRAQMAALDKELFANLSAGLTPQKKAKLALVLAKMGQMQKGMRGGRGGHQGR
jgi:hypothetical protein